MNKRQEQGFTFIELLVVIAIIGVLAAIALPKYKTHRAVAFDSRAQIALRNTAIAEEAYYVDTEEYATCSEADCHAVLPGIGPASKGVVLQMHSAGNSFNGTASHNQGTGAVFSWDNS
jgi:type IV pilus assembly protein PilA